MPPPPINITADEEGCTNPPNNPSNSSVVLPAPSMQCRPNLTDATTYPRLAAHPPQQLRATPPETNAAAFSVLSSSQNNNNSNNASSSAHPNSTVSTLHPSSAGLIENTGRWTAEEHVSFGPNYLFFGRRLSLDKDANLPPSSLSSLPIWNTIQKFTFVLISFIICSLTRSISHDHSHAHSPASFSPGVGTAWQGLEENCYSHPEPYRGPD